MCMSCVFFCMALQTARLVVSEVMACIHENQIATSSPHSCTRFITKKYGTANKNTSTTASPAVAMAVAV
jgi:hypothetical protein